MDASDEECLEAARKANIMKLFTNENINEAINAEKPRNNNQKMQIKKIWYQEEKNKDYVLQELF